MSDETRRLVRFGAGRWGWFLAGTLVGWFGGCWAELEELRAENERLRAGARVDMDWMTVQATEIEEWKQAAERAEAEVERLRELREAADQCANESEERAAEAEARTNELRAEIVRLHHSDEEAVVRWQRRAERAEAEVERMNARESRLREAHAREIERLRASFRRSPIERQFPQITDELVERAARAAWNKMRERNKDYAVPPFDGADTRRYWLDETRAALEAVFSEGER